MHINGIGGDCPGKTEIDVRLVEQGIVAMRRDPFSMPSTFTLETLPQPSDTAVPLREIPAHRVAV